MSDINVDLLKELEIKRIRTDEDELNSNTQDALKINEMINKYITENSIIDKEIRNLPPIGVYYHNKIIELYKEYKAKNIKYLGTFNSAIQHYLSHITYQAAENILKHAKNITESSPLKIFKSKIQKKDYLEEYKKLSDEMLNFTLKKDGIKALNYEIDFLLKQDWFDYEEMIKTIDEYNKQLEKFGINDRLEYRQNIKRKKKKFETNFENINLDELTTQTNKNHEENEKFNEEMNKMLNEYENNNINEKDNNQNNNIINK